MPIGTKAIRVSLDLHEWHERVEELIARGARIIAFRGAGAVNGIEPRAAEAAVSTLHDYVTGIIAGGNPVVLMYDGDHDNRQKPDIGSIFGSLVDSLDNDSGVTAIAVQKQGWYNPQSPNGPLESATGKPFETYVFPDDVPDAHAALTQSEALVDYTGYEQILVGPLGPVAFNQLGDLNRKSTHRPPGLGRVKATVLATPNNPAIDNDLYAQLGAAADEQTRSQISAKLDQRAQQPYGALFTPAGEFSVDAGRYPGIAFSIQSITA